MLNKGYKMKINGYKDNSHSHTAKLLSPQMKIPLSAGKCLYLRSNNKNSQKKNYIKANFKYENEDTWK